MSLINKLFGGSTEPKKAQKISWIPLNKVEQLKQIADGSKTKTQIIFKHSTSCGISQMMIKRFTRDYELTEADADLYYLDLLSYREVSNEIARSFQVAHQSPQLLVIKDGTVAAHASHSAISQIALEKYI